jgi:hypothetical protein
MSAHFPTPDRDCQQEQVVDLSELALDLRRVLTIQFKEFIHHIEDVQGENDLPHNPRVVNFLERCLREAA